MTDQTIYVTSGAVEFTWPTTITETTGKNITGDTVVIGLGTYTTVPATFYTPDVIEHPTDSSTTVQLLVGTGGTVVPVAGTYYVWVKVTDSPEIAPRRAAKLVIT